MRQSIIGAMLRCAASVVRPTLREYKIEQKNGCKIALKSILRPVAMPVLILYGDSETENFGRRNGVRMTNLGRQKKAFCESEGDGWYERNRAVLVNEGTRVKDDPVIASLSAHHIEARSILE